MTNFPQKCPSCAGAMAVTQLTCTNCGTGVMGRFETSPFLRLTDESLRFLEKFIRNRGNIKEMERESGISYWAIRRQLDDVIAEMGFEPAEAAPTPLTRQEILERLSRGEINVPEATRLLKELGKQA